MVAYARGIVRIPRKTETKGTDIVVPVEPTSSTRVLITRVSCKQSDAAAVLTFMNPRGKTTIAALNATANTVTLTADPGDIADNDYVAIRKADGSLNVLVVASLSTLTFTLSHTAGDYVVGDEVYWYGVEGDSVHEQTPLAVSSTVDIEAENGWYVAENVGYPILLHHNNPVGGAADCVVEGGIAHLIGV